jgi:rRNA maturation endonuclease Nob1
LEVEGVGGKTMIEEIVHPKYRCSICGKEFDSFVNANLHDECAHPQKGYFYPNTTDGRLK